MVTTAPAILVVDDLPRVRKVVRSVLEADGHAALLLLDSTGEPRDDAAARASAEDAGADGCITKPFSAVELLEAVRELVALVH